MGHEYQVHCSNSFHINLIQAVDSCNKGLGIFIQVLKVLSSHLVNKELFLFYRYSFDYKVLVVAEKEEATTGAARFTCFKNSKSIHLSIEWLHDLIIRYAVRLSKSCKTVDKIPFYIYFLVQTDKFILGDRPLKFFVNACGERYVATVYKLLLMHVLPDLIVKYFYISHLG